MAKSKEAQFISEVFEKMELPKNPLVAILVGQLRKLSQLIDENPEYQAKVRDILNYIKENWE